MGWFDFLKSEPVERRRYNVGTATATVMMKDGAIYKQEFVGSVLWAGEFEMVIHAMDRFRTWRKEGKSGTLNVGIGLYVPICDVATIEVEKDSYFVFEDNTPAPLEAP